jgi:hypothetical protein
MVLLGPLLKLLHRRYRLPCWLIGSSAWSRELYLGHPDVARIWSFHSRHTPLLLGPTWWRVLSALRCSGQSPNYASTDADRAPRIEVSGAKRLECAAWVRSSGWSGRPIILIQPGNRRSMRHHAWRRESVDDKSWAVPRGAELLASFNNVCR